MAPAATSTADAVKRLREDWLAENSDAREEGTTRWQLNSQIQTAKDRSNADPEGYDKLLDLAMAYGVLDPCDKRCLNVCERLAATGISTLDTQRQGEAYQLFGRSLFLAGRFEESLVCAAARADLLQGEGQLQAPAAEQPRASAGFLALGRGREASERLEVALTLVEEVDDAVMLYVSAKQALEFTGKDRDKEILDDIWYVYLDTHAEAKAKFESYTAAGEGVLRQCGPAGEERHEDAPASWAEVWERCKDPDVWREVLPLAFEDMKSNPFLRSMLGLAAALLAVYFALMVSVAIKGK
eukprot:CAMPEP_0176070606 /NCGR_PEP_ID=MMETSP0120_2-20121206/35261_1 /TAXON_ID=160619 /ORGANISM="Kryptoperidinium foliaceum, Strain CCMP 1326" /LENGTH=297 /DNA_ID=CAMNT_0017404255 /DNA_START=73 /DNA_END=967 /DNA_ORIENTATION=-